MIRRWRIINPVTHILEMGWKNVKNQLTFFGFNGILQVYNLAGHVSFSPGRAGSGNNSSGRVSPFQGESCEFESRFPLQRFSSLEMAYSAGGRIVRQNAFRKSPHSSVGRAHPW